MSRPKKQLPQEAQAGRSGRRPEPPSFARRAFGAREQQKKTLRWLAVIAGAPAVILVILIGGFVARSQLAHDEETCPFHEVERRELGRDLVVVDENRRCQEGVEEHRWVVLRRDVEREIGRRRLMRELYAEDRYRWTATLDDGNVHIAIQNDGTEPARFREDPPGGADPR